MKRLISLLILAGCSTAANNAPPGQLTVQVKNAEQKRMDQELEKSSKAMYHFLLGELQYDRQDFEGALKNFETASKLVKQPAPELHAKLTELFVRTGELDKALVEIEKARSQNPEDTDIMLLHAGVLEAAGRPDEAEPIYRRLIELKPDSMDSYILLSSLYSKKERYDDAIALLNRYLKSNPREVVGLATLARTYEMKGNLKKSDQILNQATRYHPNNVNIAIELLRIKIKQKKITEAKKLCNEILEKDPNNIVARKILGQLLLGESNFDEALKHLQILETVEVDPKDSRFKIALIQIGRQNFKEAITELNLVLAADPEYPEARYYLASSYVATGRKREAIEELLKISKEDKMYVQSRTLAAFLLRQENEFKQAYRAINEAYQIRPDDLSIVSYMVVILRDLGRLDEAKKLLEESLERSGEKDKLLFSYGTLLAEMGAKKESMEVLERLVQINPKHSDALNFIAYQLAEENRELERAETLVKKALEIRPNDGYYLDTLGWIYFLMGRLSEALQHLSRAVTITGEDPVILEHYVEALLKSGDKEKALEQLGIGARKEQDTGEPENSKAIERMRKKYKELGGA